MKSIAIKQKHQLKANKSDEIHESDKCNCQTLSMNGFDKWFKSCKVEFESGNRYLVLTDYDNMVEVLVDEQVSLHETDWRLESPIDLTEAQRERIYDLVYEFINPDTGDDYGQPYSEYDNQFNYIS